MILRKKGAKSARRKDRYVKRDPQRDFNGFLTQLADPDPAVRRWGARDLSNFPEAARPLCEHLPRENDMAVREAVFSSLLEIGNEEVVRGLVPLLRSDEASLRNGAIEVLQQLPEAVAPHIRGLLDDEDPDVRIFAIDILRSLAHPQAPAWLQELLEREDHVNVVATALDLLAELGTPDMLPVLQRIRERFGDEPFLCFSLDLVMKRIQE